MIARPVIKLPCGAKKDLGRCVPYCECNLAPNHKEPHKCDWCEREWSDERTA